MRKPFLSIVLCLPLATSAAATDHLYGWTISASDTDPYVNSGNLTGTTNLYLWLVCAPDEGADLVEFGLHSDTGTIHSMIGQNGFLVYGVIPATIGMDGTGCPVGPVVAASLLVSFSAPGNLCFVPSASNLNVTVGCVTSDLQPNDWIGFAHDGGDPCANVDGLCGDDPPPPPLNDTCDTAIDIPRCVPFSDTGTLYGMMDDYTLSSDGCTGRFSLGAEAVYKIDMQTGDMLTATYTVLDSDASLYLIWNCDDPEGSCVVGSDHDEWGGTETITWTAPLNLTYYLICDTWDPAPGDYSLDVTFQCPTPVEDASWGRIKTTYR